jgi:molybdate transport system substrate-binding protein
VTRGKTNLRARLAFCSFIALLLALIDLRAQEQKVRIAAAADLKSAMEELSAKFESKTGIKVDVASGSSGNFFSQIQNGAPFDLFFSADLLYPKKLAEAGFAEPGTLLEYALGRIAIWMPAGSKVDVTKQGWSALLDASVIKIAIANPEHAPYGLAAVSAIKKAGIYEKVQTKLVYGENILQAAQFVQSGNAQAGIIALSLALTPGMKEGKTWIIPAETYAPIKQGAVLLKRANNKTAARAFLEFVKSAPGREILEKHGFAIPASN